MTDWHRLRLYRMFYFLKSKLSCRHVSNPVSKQIFIKYLQYAKHYLDSKVKAVNKVDILALSHFRLGETKNKHINKTVVFF